ncbi:RluA family pseudouridine synthase [Flammeovirga kamogawensis]|uniref:RluA family pseudouridine synthase n=1 Tax=Flammeovirga kamogawensis TaxID=373891 RepID=A0ABX8GTF9_9BACT|nr:RluA family pseudouridine synthase [Flammeovirga kamogawensis]MBB6463716.1 23S rRNA pseudouridine1911/1915/1917 synthase [Flammeovirga kamogawensis]QWG06215.1 RluA family pseudouridine synthase [Flammeovirga kamogawensis]TRX68046.1 RluA family pseudouridine synthase [Flammeovirga kamogawensis]
MNLDQSQIIYEDNHLVVVNKAPGILVQGDETGDETLTDIVKQYVKEKYNKPGAVFLAPVHRLDRPVSGVVVFARTSKAAERMAKIFHDHKITKTYMALVEKRPQKDADTLINWMKKDDKKNRSHVYQSEKKGGKYVETHYQVLGRVGDNYCLEVTPKTGRSHQIRAQLGNIAAPIKGDMKYGSKKQILKGKMIFLHARQLQFEHPVKKEPMRFTARLPEHDIWKNFTEMSSTI